MSGKRRAWRAGYHHIMASVYLPFHRVDDLMLTSAPVPAGVNVDDAKRLPGGIFRPELGMAAHQGTHIPANARC